jgi:hypothetical protein
MRNLFLIFISILISSSTFAQKQSKKDKRDQNRKRVDALIKQEEEGVIAYTKHFVYGGKLINRGYGVFLEAGRMKSIKKGMLFQLELSEYKALNQEKYPFNFSLPFVYGKQNFFYPVKIGLQQQILFGNKSNKNGVSITGNFGGGVSVGLLRPYYVQLVSSGEFIKYDSTNTTTSADFLNASKISGGPGFSKGWSDIKVTPGAYVKTALRFDYGIYNEVVSALEVGIAADYYSKKIPLMVRNESKQFFFTGYVAIIFGRRK